MRSWVRLADWHLPSLTDGQFWTVLSGHGRECEHTTNVAALVAKQKLIKQFSD